MLKCRERTGKERDAAMEKIHLPHQHESQQNLEGLRRELCRVEDFQSVASAFKQLEDATRLRIFWLLCHCEACVTNISAMMEMSSPAVSHHLRQLKAGGLILGRREGKEVYYRSADTACSRLLHQVIEQIMEINCPK